MSQWYRIHDKRTNKQVNAALYFTEASAQSNINLWRERKVLSKKDLDNLIIVPVEIDIPNHQVRQVDNVKN